jgi:serine/threonine protein kinase
MTQRTTIKNYTIIEQLGEGTFGMVYRGINNRNNTNVAIKFEKKIQGLNVLKHEVSILNYLYTSGVRNIPAIHWYGIHNDIPTLIMTYYSSSLHDYFIRKERIDEYRMSSVMVKCINILEHLSKNMVIHRDIKPNNFMILDGDIHLIDFGLATIYSCEYINEDDIIGSPKYASYFMHCGEPNSYRDDLLSLGYMYLFLNSGSLDWQDIPDVATTYSKTHIHHPNNIIRRNAKEIDTLSQTMNGSIHNYMDYCYSLKCDDVPNYHILMELFCAKSPTEKKNETK